MVRFAGLLLIVTMVTVGADMLGLVPLALGEAATLSIVVWFHLLSTYLVLSLLGIVTPLLMFTTFKPVRESMKKILTCRCKDVKAENSASSSTPQS